MQHVSSRNIARTPEKGVFPLDHFNECKHVRTLISHLPHSCGTFVQCQVPPALVKCLHAFLYASRIEILMFPFSTSQS